MQYGNADYKDKHHGLCDVSDIGQNNIHINFDSDDDSQPMPETSESVKVKWKSVISVEISTNSTLYQESEVQHSQKEVVKVVFGS